MFPKIYIGPMSINIVDVIIRINAQEFPVGLIPSRRQVEWDGGYVNDWTTTTFSDYVRKRHSSLLLCRDHAGPSQGDSALLTPDDGLKSLSIDCDNFDIIHLDPWKICESLGDGIDYTIDLLNFCHEKNPKVQYEIGTEEAIFPMTPEDLDHFIYEVKDGVADCVFSKVIYAVIQSGTRLQQGRNIGSYDASRLDRMIEVVRSHGLMSKEHNGDWITNEEIEDKFQRGLDAINIAPEFGQLESEAYISVLSKDPTLMEEMFWGCYRSDKWRKWVPECYEPVSPQHKILVPKDELIRICGHYIFSSPLCELIRAKYPQINDAAKEKISNRLMELHQLC